MSALNSLKLVTAKRPQNLAPIVQRRNKLSNQLFEQIQLAQMSRSMTPLFTREDAEKDLVFCGFVVAECPLKPDTKAIIQELVDASHEIKMITGDNALTAAFIGQELKFGNGPSLFANQGANNSQLIWKDIDDKQVAVTNNP